MMLSMRTARVKGVLAGLLLLLSGTAAAQGNVLRLGHVTPPSHVWHQTGVRIAENLARESGGRMTVRVQPLSRLGSEAQMINLLQSGAMQLGILTAGSLANREPSFQAWSLPYVIKDVADANRAAETPAAEEMLKRLDVHGMIGMGYVMAGMRHVLSISPVSTPADMRGSKIRSFPNPVYNDWWTAMRAAPTAMPLSEVAPSLNTHLLDAVDVDLDALVGLKLHQQAPNLSMTHHMPFPAVIVVSKRYWAGLSEQDRRILKQAIDEARQWGYGRAVQAEADNLAKVRADGVQLPEVDIEAFRQLAEPIVRKYTAANPLIHDFAEQVDSMHAGKEP